MALIQRKTEEEKAAAAEQRAAAQAAAAEKAEEKRAALREQWAAAEAAKQAKEGTDAIEKARKYFYSTPAGQAREAYERGDHVFQYAYNVMSQEAVIVSMVGSATRKKTSDPSAILNSVCMEGWELITGSFVFVEEGHQSRDKFLASGQNTAIKGKVMGYYLFRRAEQLHANYVAEPWLMNVAQ